MPYSCLIIILSLIMFKTNQPKENMNINNLKITVKPKYNYGYKVGVTVHING